MDYKCGDNKLNHIYVSTLFVIFPYKIGMKIQADQLIHFCIGFDQTFYILLSCSLCEICIW